MIFTHLSQLAIMAQDGFALLKQVAAAHLGNAAVQVELWGAVCSLAGNADNNKVRPSCGVGGAELCFPSLADPCPYFHCVIPFVSSSFHD